MKVKRTTVISVLLLMVISLMVVSCASGPKAQPQATAAEIAAAEVEVQEAEAKLAAAEAEARAVAEIAKNDQSQANIAAFMVKKDEWDTANGELSKAKAKLRKLQQSVKK
jgi:hypothetical protein